MDVKVDPTYLLFASFAVVGIIEWIKSVIMTFKAKNGSWKWPVFSFIVSS